MQRVVVDARQGPGGLTFHPYHFRGGDGEELGLGLVVGAGQGEVRQRRSTLQVWRDSALSSKVAGWQGPAGLSCGAILDAVPRAV